MAGKNNDRSGRGKKTAIAQYDIVSALVSGDETRLLPDIRPSVDLRESATAFFQLYKIGLGDVNELSPFCGGESETFSCDEKEEEMRSSQTDSSVTLDTIVQCHYGQNPDIVRMLRDLCHSNLIAHDRWLHRVFVGHAHAGKSVDDVDAEVIVEGPLGSAVLPARFVHRGNGREPGLAPGVPVNIRRFLIPVSEQGTQVSQEEFLEDEMHELEHAIAPFLGDCMVCGIASPSGMAILHCGHHLVCARCSPVVVFDVCNCFCPTCNRLVGPMHNIIAV